MEKLQIYFTNLYGHCGHSWEIKKCTSIDKDECPICNKLIEPTIIYMYINGEFAEIMNNVDAARKRVSHIQQCQNYLFRYVK